MFLWSGQMSIPCFPMEKSRRKKRILHYKHKQGDMEEGPSPFLPAFPKKGEICDRVFSLPLFPGLPRGKL